MSFKKIPKKDKSEDDKAKHSTNMPTVVKSYLDEKYDIRKNTISGIIEGKAKTEKAYSELNENDVFIEMHENNIKVGKDMLKAVLRSSFIEDHNPIIEYFASLKKWNPSADPDHIKKLCSFIKSENDELFLLHFTKHLVRCIACVMIPNYFNKQCFVIVSPKQDLGKTSFIRFLNKGTILENYYTENVSIDKDGRFTLTENIIINLDELAGMSKYEINQLKAFISYDKIKEREAYAAQKTTRTRIASFFATTNDLNFLNDLTGSSRWVCFQVFNIDFKYSTSIDISKVWAQAYALFTSGTFEYNLTKDEKQANEIANQKHTVISPEQEAIQMYYEPSDKDKTPDTTFLSATEIAEVIAKHSTFKQTVYAIGRTLPKIGFKQVIAKDKGITKRGYYVRYLYGADTPATAETNKPAEQSKVPF